MTSRVSQVDGFTDIQLMANYIQSALGLGRSRLMRFKGRWSLDLSRTSLLTWNGRPRTLGSGAHIGQAAKSTLCPGKSPAKNSHPCFHHPPTERPASISSRTRKGSQRGWELISQADTGYLPRSLMPSGQTYQVRQGQGDCQGTQGVGRAPSSPRAQPCNSHPAAPAWSWHRDRCGD